MSKFGPLDRQQLLYLFKQLWHIGHEQGWFGPIPVDFPRIPRPQEAPDYRPTRPPPLEDVGRFLAHLSKGADTLPGQRGYTLATIVFFTGIR